MDRREALKTVALLLGGTVINSQVFLTGCSSATDENDELFTQSDIALLDEIGETIIPATDTPGAKAVGVGNFMAMMLPDCYSERNQENFRKGLDKIRNDFNNEFAHSFMEAEPEERQHFLQKLDAEIPSYDETKTKNDPDHYFRIMKELTLLGYFTSKAGCTQARRYKQTPGRYQACTDYTEGDKAWSIP